MKANSQSGLQSGSDRFRSSISLTMRRPAELLEGVDLHIALPLIMPLPPPLGLALAGLIGVVLFRRRMAS